jgi:WD40 repeat protein
MAPEQIEAASGVDERADIFSFGVCLYEMLCGNRPYPTTIGKPIEAPDPAAVARNKDFPRNLATLLIKCVQWNPNNRPDSFSEIRDSLNSNYRELFRHDSPYHALRKVELDADGFNNRGVSLYELGRFEEAANNFRRALEIQSSHPQASHNLSLLSKDESSIQQLKITEPKPLYQIERMERDLAAALEKVDTYIRNGTNNGAFSLLMDTWARSQFKRDSRFSDRYQRLYDKRKSSAYNSLIFAREEASYTGHAGAVNSVSFSPDGKHALSAGADKTLRLWKIETGQCAKVFTGHTGAVNSVSISADGRYALSGSSDTTVRLWELSTAQCLKILKGHSDAVNAVLFLSDVCFEAPPAVSEGRGNIFSSLGGGSLLGEPSKINTPRAGRPSALSGGTDKNLHLWDLNAGVSIENLQKAQEPGTPERIILPYQNPEPVCEYDPVLCIAVDHEGKRALTGSFGNSLILWDIEKKKRRATLKGHTEGVNSVAFSPNRSYAVSGSLDNTIRLWNLDYRTSSVQSEHHSDAVTSLSISSDGSYILSGSMDETVRLWGMSYSYLSCEKILDHGGPVTSVCFSPDSQYALSASTDRTIKLWRFFWDMHF